MNEAEAIDRVVRLACLTEDRDSQEQRALIDTAFRADLDRARMTALRLARGDSRPPELVALVVETYRPESGRRIEPTAAQERQLRRASEKWERCAECGKYRGQHAAIGCPG